MGRIEDRRRIDEIDSRIVELIVERMGVVDRIGREKIQNNEEVFDANREKKVIGNARMRAVELDGDPDAVEKIYEKILQLSRAHQGDLYFESSLKKGRSILIVNGPNINMLGVREPSIYGYENYAYLLALIEKRSVELGVDSLMFQSNHEGDIVDCIQAARGVFSGIVINPGAYTHTSIAILDALKAVAIPAVEVHISDIDNREDYRKVSIVGEACVKAIYGHGLDGYVEAIEYLAEMFV